MRMPSLSLSSAHKIFLSRITGQTRTLPLPSTIRVSAEGNNASQILRLSNNDSLAAGLSRLLSR